METDNSAAPETSVPAVGDTPEGIIVGADATESRYEPVKESAREPISARYTEDDLNRVREQEKSKLYSRLDRMNEEIENLRRDREERERLEQERLQQEQERLQQEQARQQEEEESGMDVRTLLARKEEEWERKLAEVRAEQERDRALLEQERALAELESYTRSRVEQERDNILPELLDLVSGSTPEEIDASIESLKVRSDRIFDSAQQAMSTARREVVGSRVTMPSPLENPSENSSFTPQDIRSMSMQEYAKHRQRLLSDQAQGRTRGLFG